MHHHCLGCGTRTIFDQLPLAIKPTATFPLVNVAGASTTQSAEEKRRLARLQKIINRTVHTDKNAAGPKGGSSLGSFLRDLNKR